VNINKARILKIKPRKPNISGRILITDSQFDGNCRDNNVSFIYKPDVKPTYLNASRNESNRCDSVSFIYKSDVESTYFNASYNEPNRSDSVSFIFHL